VPSVHLDDPPPPPSVPQTRFPELSVSIVSQDTRLLKRTAPTVLRVPATYALPVVVAPPLIVSPPVAVPLPMVDEARTPIPIVVEGESCPAVA